MSFEDPIVLVAFAFLFITVSLVGMYIWTSVSPSLSAQDHSNFTTTMNSSINQSVSFWNTGLATVYILLCLASIILTVFLSSNPALLVVWMLMCVVTLFVWDSLNDVLAVIAASTLNGGQMSSAISFFQSDIPKLVPLVNLLIGIFMFGKGALGGGGRL